MKRPIQIVLLTAVFLIAGNTASFSASTSEHSFLFSQTTEQSIHSIPDSSGEPLAHPDSRPAYPGNFQIDSLLDIEFSDLQSSVSGIQSGTIRLYSSKPGKDIDARNITLLLKRKKIIYPFHSFL